MPNEIGNGHMPKFLATVNGSSPPVTEAFTKHGEIGRGRFAKVCKLKHKGSGKLFAAKIIRRRRLGKDTTDTIQKEIDILQSATAQSVDSIVSLRNVFASSSEVTLILDYAAGGELFRLVCSDGPLPESFVRCVISQLLDALRFLHANRVVHLDIKPDNILLHAPYPGRKVLLCDFGLAKVLDEGKEQRDIVGTPDYVAPEILDYAPITTQADMWSLGVVTFFLLTGISPFLADSKEETLSKISLVQIDYGDLEDEHSDEVRDFLSSIIQLKPGDRLTAKKAIGHEWFKMDDLSHANGVSSQLSSCPTLSAPASRLSDKIEKGDIAKTTFTTPTKSSSSCSNGPALVEGASSGLGRSSADASGRFCS